MDIAIDIIGNRDVIDQVVSVQVKIIDAGILRVELSFKLFKRFGFLKKLHYCIKIEVVPRKSQVFFRPILG